MAITTTLSIWIALLAVGMLVAVVIWANQRELAFQASEARANQAESRAATAEAPPGKLTVPQPENHVAAILIGAPALAAPPVGRNRFYGALDPRRNTGLALGY